MMIPLTHSAMRLAYCTSRSSLFQQTMGALIIFSNYETFALTLRIVFEIPIWPPNPKKTFILS